MKKRKTAILMAVIAMLGVMGCEGGEKHEWGEWVTTKEATCTEKGEETRVCEKNGEHKEKRELAAKGHEWGEWETEKEAGCVMSGRERRVCKNDASHSETRSIEAKGHEWGEWKESKAPTLTEEGEETRVCKNDASHSETRKTGKLKKVTESIRIENGKEIEATENADKEIELKVMIKYERAEEKAAESSDVTYSSNNHETATVNSEGVITIKKAGEAEITVESVNGNAEGVRISERIKVTVKHARTEKLEVTSSKRYTLVRGIEDVKQGVTSEATAQIEVKIKYEGSEERAGGKEDVIYKSSNEEVASVDEEGKISFNGEGTATIKVESKYEKEGGGKMEESIAVQVNAPPENTTGLEVVSFGNGEIGDKVVIKNVSNNNITTRIVDVYFLDKTNKILGSSFFYLVQSFTPITIKPGEEVSDNIWKVLPVGTTKILIYNERIEETIS